MHDNDDTLFLDHQASFPLYLASKELIRAYAPMLDALGLTYTQYLAMTLLWERGQMTSREMGQEMALDSGTLTPLLRTLEGKGFVRRRRSESDKRNLTVALTKEGLFLKENARVVSDKMNRLMGLSSDERSALTYLLYKVLAHLDQTK